MFYFAIRQTNQKNRNRIYGIYDWLDLEPENDVYIPTSLSQPQTRYGHVTEMFPSGPCTGRGNVSADILFPVCAYYTQMHSGTGGGRGIFLVEIIKLPGPTRCTNG